MPAARSIRTLTDAEKQGLRKLYRQTDKADLRTRCQMILLSSEGYSVLYWFDRYEAESLNGLEDRPRSGRPPKSQWPM